MANNRINSRSIPIKKIEDYYIIEKSGKIYSLRRSRYLIPQLRKDGYYSVNLAFGLGLLKYLIHQLVCTKYHGERPSGKVVNHKDGIKSNNRESNLEWTTIKKNNIHARKLGLVKKKTGVINNKFSAKININQALEIRKLYKEGNMRYKDLGLLFSISTKQVGKIIRKEVWL